MIKKLLLTTFAILCALILNAQNYVQIGSGTVSTTMPFYSSWNYSWSSLIYNQTDIGSAKSITKIAFFATNAKTMTNQKIYMKLTTDAVFANTNYEDPSNVANGYTLVFDGTLTTTANAWVEITLIAPFAYDGVKNIVIHGESRWGQSYGANFYSTASTTNNNKNGGSDLSFPTGAGYVLNPNPSSLTNIRFYYTSTDPATPSDETPVSASIKVNAIPTLKFKLGANTTTYDVFISTDKTKVDASDATVKVVANAAFTTAGFYEYTITNLLTSKTKYYWKVVAKNATASTAGPTWEFITQRVNSTFPYEQKFSTLSNGDNVFFKGWYGSFTEWDFPTKDPANSTITTWACTEKTPSTPPNPADNDSVAYITSSYFADGTEYSLRSSRFNLSGNAGKYKISFEWKNENTVANSQHECYFEVTKDGGTTWTTLATLTAGIALNVYKLETIDLAGNTSNNVYFRWRYKKFTADAKNVYLDNIAVSENNGLAEISLDKTTYIYGDICIGGKTTYNLKISNPSTTPLVLTGTTKTGDFNCTTTFPVTIPAGGNQSLPIVFNPQTVGNLTGSVTFTAGTALGTNVITLSGKSVAAKTSYFEAFDAVANNTIPAEWNRFYNSIDGNVWCWVKSSTFNGDYISPSSALLMYNNQGLASASAPALMLITPGLANFSTNKLVFQAKHGSSYSPLEIGVTDDPYNASAFVSLTSINLSPNFTSYTVDINALAPGNTKPYIVFRHPQIDVMRKIYIEDVSWDNPSSTTPPAAAVLVSPKDNVVDIPNMMQVSLKWSSGGGNPTGYFLSIGKTPAANDILNAFDMGTTTSKTFTNLDFNTQYYWKVVPYNLNGEATTVPVWKFKTQTYPVVNTFPYAEGFEICNDSLSAYPNRFPLGWSIENGNDNFTWTLIRNSAFQNARTGDIAMHAFSTSNAQGMKDLLFSRPIAMRKGYRYDVEFYYKTSTLMDPYSVEKLQVGYGKDNTSAAVANVVWDNTLDNRSYTKGTCSIVPTENADFYVSFICLSAANQGLLLIDDITINETALSTVATLSDLKAGATTVTGFNAATLNYTVEVPKGTTQVPAISATTTDPNATMTITQAVNLTSTIAERTAKVVVKAEDGVTTKTYTVVIDFPKSNLAEMLTFTMPNQVGTTVMDAAAKTINITLPSGSSATQIATFTVSPNATVMIGTTAQVSGTTSNSFASAVVYKILAENGTTFVNWTVNVTIAKSTAADITTFQLPNQIGTSVINATAHTIAVTLPAGSNTNQIASFVLSAGAAATVGTVAQVSGTTSNNFATPVVYRVVAENTTTALDWTVTVSFGTGIENTKVEKTQFAVFPNPSNGVFNLNIPELNSQAQLQIMNNLGQVIYNQSINSGKETISVKNPMMGIYFIKVISKDKEYHSKLLIK